MNEEKASPKTDRIPLWQKLMVLIAVLTALSAMLLAVSSWIQLAACAAPDFYFTPIFDEDTSTLATTSASNKAPDDKFVRLIARQAGGRPHKLQSITLMSCSGTQGGEDLDIGIGKTFMLDHYHGKAYVVGIAEYVTRRCKGLDNLAIDVGYTIRGFGLRVHREYTEISLLPTADGSDGKNQPS